MVTTAKVMLGPSIILATLFLGKLPEAAYQYFVHIHHLLTNALLESEEREMAVEMSHLMGKPTICICENKGTDQLRGNCGADQHLCFCYMDGTLPLLLKSEISSF